MSMYIVKVSIGFRYGYPVPSPYSIVIYRDCNTYDSRIALRLPEGSGLPALRSALRPQGKVATATAMPLGAGWGSATATVRLGAPRSLALRLESGGGLPATVRGREPRGSAWNRLALRYACGSPETEIKKKKVKKLERFLM
jgi:hypothetical protein